MKRRAKLRPQRMGGRLLLAFSMSMPFAVSADATLHYQIKSKLSDEGKVQPIWIKDGQVFVKGAGGDASTDLRYNQSPEALQIVDHRRRSVMAVDERQIDRLLAQVHDVQPLLAGLGQQIAKLTPSQRAKWERMLGTDVPLDRLADLAKPMPSLTLTSLGRSKTIAGISCEQMQVFEGKAQRAETCLAQAKDLHLTDGDANTVRALFGFYERLAGKAQGIASQFGIQLPALPSRNTDGVPLELRDLNGESLVLQDIDTSVLNAEQFGIPPGYRKEALQFWK